MAVRGFTPLSAAKAKTWAWIWRPCHGPGVAWMDSGVQPWQGRAW